MGLFEKCATAIFLTILGGVCYVVLFNGDLNAVTTQALAKMPAAATMLSVMLPTSTILTPTKSTVIRPTPKPGAGVGSGTGVVVSGSGGELADCATAPTTVACEWKNGPPTTVPSPTMPVYKACTEQGETFYSCEDLEKMRNESRTAVASGEGTEQDAAVVKTDDFINNVPTTPPAVKQEWIDACKNTPPDKRDGFLKPICDGAGL